MSKQGKLGVMLFVLLVALALVAAGCGGSKTAADKQQSAAPASESESKVGSAGTLYVAGMGGHLAKVEVEIDPTDTAEPIKILDLDKVRLGKAEGYGTHDARIDHDRGILYSAVFVRNPDGKVNIASVDLSTGKVKKDAAISVSDRYVDGPLYCASGQSKDAFIPVVMGYEGYIDVIDKDSLELKHRIHLDHPEIPKDYIWAHGVHTPDMKQFLLTISSTAPDRTGKGLPRNSEDVLFYLLDMEQLLQGKLQIIKKGAIKGDPAKTASLRQHYTHDGKYLMQTVRDRLWIIDAETFELVHEEKFPVDENIEVTTKDAATGAPVVKKAQLEVHDAIATKDDKYAVLTMRIPVKSGETNAVMDGSLLLFDLEKKAIVGKPVSVCNSCHVDEPDLKDKSAVLCGLDAVWEK